MGSIRPLVTITILVVVGAYLYVKINEGPSATRPGAANNLSQTPDGIPPLTGTKGASLAADSGAPAWPPTAASTPPPIPTAPSATTSNSATANSPAATMTAKNNLTAVPAIPELPPLPAMNEPA